MKPCCLRRRDFLLITGEFAGFCLEADQTDLRPWSHSFHLAVPPDQFIQHFLVGQDGIYYVNYHPASQASFLGYATFSGEQKLLFPLPLNIFYSGLGIRKTGTFVLPCANRSVGMEIVEFTRSGTLLRVTPLQNGQGILAYAIAGDWLVMLRNNGSVEAIDLQNMRSHSFSGVLQNVNGMAMYPVSEDVVLIVDRTNAQLLFFDLVNGSDRVSAINSPEIDASKRFFESKIQERRAQPSSDGNGAGFVITSSQPEANGSIYLIVYPIKRPGGALMLHASADGHVVQRFRIELPDPTTQRHLPAHLVAQNGELDLVFQDGEVFAYPT